jgi:hypothetical protein
MQRPSKRSDRQDGMMETEQREFYILDLDRENGNNRGNVVACCRFRFEFVIRTPFRRSANQTEDFRGSPHSV